MRHAMALAQRQAATTNDGAPQNLFDAWIKLPQIANRIDADFQRVIRTQAQQIATADAATFDIVTFVTGWRQQSEGYRLSTEAVASFGAELKKVIDGGSAEFIEAARKKRQELQDLLDQRNEADKVIEDQIMALDLLIGGTTPAPTTGAQPTATQALQQIRQPFKRAAKKATKKAAPQAGKAAAKKATKKASKKAAKKAPIP